MSAAVEKAVDRGFEIILQMVSLKEELEGIEAILEQAALKGDQVDLNDPEREGKQYIAEGTKGTVPVVLTADVLVKTFQEDSAIHKKILAVSDNHLGDFYNRKVTFESQFESGKIFRKRADEILGDKAPDFITACVSRDKLGIPKSQIKIEWKRAEKKGVA